MNTNATQKEILLLTGTSFSSREFFETNDPASQNHLTEREKLVVACWNGLLPDILPEVFENASLVKKLYLWEVREASSFIELELGETYGSLEKQFSIDPYSFLSFQILS